MDEIQDKHAKRILGNKSDNYRNTESTLIFVSSTIPRHACSFTV